MDTKGELYAIIPAYNEQDTIKQVVSDWQVITDAGGVLVVIDDGSKDNTYSILKELESDSIVVLTKENGGHGDTLLYGYQYAINHGAKYIFQTDSDGQTNAAEFGAFWEDRDKYDAIFGVRKVRSDGTSRKFVESVLCKILWSIFHVKVPDSNAPFRLMRADKVKEYIAKLPAHYNLPNVMLTVYFTKNDRVAFREISFGKRQGGKNSINIKKIVGIGKQAVKDFRKLAKET